MKIVLLKYPKFDKYINLTYDKGFHQRRIIITPKDVDIFTLLYLFCLLNL